MKKKKKDKYISKYSSACKTKVMSKLLENMIPEGAKKFEKKTEGVPDASKKGPGELASQIEDATNEIQRWSPKGALGPQRFPRGQPGPKSIKFP